MKGSPSDSTRARGVRPTVSYVIEVAEAMDHRPGVELKDTTVTLTLTTRAEGGLTDKDFALAIRIKA